jgi:SulP family sulfate permease
MPWLAWPKADSRLLVADGLAGLTGALIVLPQALAFATLAGLPPQYGLYAAMVPAAVAAWFGSSWQGVSGPNNALSLMLFAALSPLFTPGTPDYVAAALTLAFFSGLLVFAVGFFRLGSVTNFISPAVVATLSAGIGILIVISQLPMALGLPSPSAPSAIATLRAAFGQITYTEPLAMGVCALTLAVGFAAAKAKALGRVPPLLVALVVGTAFAILVDPQHERLRVLGVVPAALPSLTLPSMAMSDFQRLFPLSAGIAAFTLIQGIATTRAVAHRAGQRLDVNRQLMAEGLSNVAASFTSGYPGCTSFNRTMANYDAGARSPRAAIAAAVLLPLLVYFVAPLLARLPFAMMAGVLILVGVRLVDVKELRRLASAGRTEAGVIWATLAATLLLSLDTAIFLGVAMSLAVYLHRSGRPRFATIVPNPRSQTRKAQEIEPGRHPECPQFKMVRIDGGLYFGSVEQAEEGLEGLRGHHPEQRHLMIASKGISYMDVAGARLLGEEAQRRRGMGGALYLHAPRGPILAALENTGQLELIGRDNVFESKHDALATIVPKRLDPAICATCRARILHECARQPGPKD